MIIGHQVGRREVGALVVLLIDACDTLGCCRGCCRLLPPLWRGVGGGGSFGQASAAARPRAVDPSVASKMVTDCINGGYLERRASLQDGRRTVVVLTRKGIRLRDQFRRQHRQAFVQITQDWPERKRLQFAQLLIDYVEACTALTNRRGPNRVNHD